MLMRQRTMVAAAFSLTALSYGLTRFAYGLLLPSIRLDLDLSATSAGWIGGLAFASYCAGVVLAFTLDARFGERCIATAAGLCATVAMASIATSLSGGHLGFAMALGGLSTGLTSPPLTAAVARSVFGPVQARGNGIINAGTAAGIVISGTATIAFNDNWRGLYAAFACVGLVTTLLVWWAMPPRRVNPAAATFKWRYLHTAGAITLVTSSFLVGFASTAVWTFGADIMRLSLNFSSHYIAIGWIVLGVVGIAGLFTGVMVNRFGLTLVHRISVAMMSIALVFLAAGNFWSLIAFIALGLFGAAYIVATGSLLLWGVSIYSQAPALGVGIPFLVVAIGQTIGAPVFGMVWETSGGVIALSVFGIVMASGAASLAKGRADVS